MLQKRFTRAMDGDTKASDESDGEAREHHDAFHLVEDSDRSKALSPKS